MYWLWVGGGPFCGCQEGRYCCHISSECLLYTTRCDYISDIYYFVLTTNVESQFFTTLPSIIDVILRAQRGRVTWLRSHSRAETQTQACLTPEAERGTCCETPARWLPRACRRLRRVTCIMKITL